MFEFHMSRPRARYALKQIQNRLQISPVVIIQGARQTGKSYLVRELLKKTHPSLHYLTLDQVTQRNLASSNPETFLVRSKGDGLLAIDEAQKSPELFDAVKYFVDQNRKPGQFILVGSTEFSKLTLVRESLTGRASRIRISPMTVSESLQLPFLKNQNASLVSSKPRVSRKDFLRFLDRGGMPGIFAVRSDLARETLLKDWLSTTIARDVMVFPKIKIQSSLIENILLQIATQEDTSAGSIASSLRVDLRKIKTHLQALETLFVIHKIERLRSSHFTVHAKVKRLTLSSKTQNLETQP